MNTKLLFGIFTFVLLFFVLIYFLVNFLPFGKKELKVDLSRDSVVKEVQKLNRLETASFTIEKVVEAGEQGNPFQDLLYGDRILLIAHGKVVAGIDLASIQNEDIIVNGKNLSVNLPAPEILSSTLDNSKTRVYDRTLGYLNRGNKDLESEARLAAEASIRQAACEGRILDEAQVNAVERIRQLFEFAGFTSVTVQVPQGSC